MKFISELFIIIFEVYCKKWVKKLDTLRYIFYYNYNIYDKREVKN